MSNRYFVQLDLVFDEDVDASVLNNVIGAPATTASGGRCLKKGVRYTICSIAVLDESLLGDIVKHARDVLWRDAGCFVEITLSAARVPETPDVVIRFGKEEYEQYVQQRPRLLIIGADNEAKE